MTDDPSVRVKPEPDESDLGTVLPDAVAFDEVESCAQSSQSLGPFHPISGRELYLMRLSHDTSFGFEVERPTGTFVVSRVHPDSAAERAGLPTGDEVGRFWILLHHAPQNCWHRHEARGVRSETLTRQIIDRRERFSGWFRECKSFLPDGTRSVPTTRQLRQHTWRVYSFDPTAWLKQHPAEEWSGGPLHLETFMDRMGLPFEPEVVDLTGEATRTRRAVVVEACPATSGLESAAPTTIPPRDHLNEAELRQSGSMITQAAAHDPPDTSTGLEDPTDSTTEPTEVGHRLRSVISECEQYVFIEPDEEMSCQREPVI